MEPEKYGVSRSGRPFRIFLDETGRRRSRFLPMPTLADVQPHLTTPASQYLFAVAYARGFTNGRAVDLAERDRLMGKLLLYMTMRELREESGLSHSRIRRILRDRAGLDAADVRALEPTAKEIPVGGAMADQEGRPEELMDAADIQLQAQDKTAAAQADALAQDQAAARAPSPGGPSMESGRSRASRRQAANRG